MICYGKFFIFLKENHIYNLGNLINYDVDKRRRSFAVSHCNSSIYFTIADNRNIHKTIVS